ncbi:MAG: hypothetical protein GY822_30135 [Deltaproteobacteria bacterium]|nr:hypothetical protein [Deltaproteobacteria bacterium]
MSPLPQTLTSALKMKPLLLTTGLLFQGLLGGGASPLELQADLAIAEAEKVIRKDDLLKRCSEKGAMVDDKVLKEASAKMQAIAYALKADCITRKAWLQKTDDQKIAVFKNSIGFAKKAITLDDKCAYCVFQAGASVGGWARSHGMLKGAMYVGEIRDYFARANELDPTFLPAVVSIATIDAQLPGWLGGNPEGAEKALTKTVKKFPRHTYARAQLAKVLVVLGKEAEGKKQAQLVLDEKRPLMPASHKRTALGIAQKVLDD